MKLFEIIGMLIAIFVLMLPGLKRMLEKRYKRKHPEEFEGPLEDMEEEEFEEVRLPPKPTYEPVPHMPHYAVDLYDKEKPKPIKSKKSMKSFIHDPKNRKDFILMHEILSKPKALRDNDTLF